VLRKYGEETATPSRMYGRTGSIQALRRTCKFRSLGAAFYFEASRNDLSKTQGCESKSSWAKTKGQAIRFPRPWRAYLEDFNVVKLFFCYADQIFVHKALTNNLGYSKIESVPISHVLPIVVAKCLFINVPEQVERLNANVGASETPLQETPEVLQPVGMNLPINVRLGVIDDLVRKLLTQAPVGKQFVGIDIRSLTHVLLNERLESIFLAVLNHGCPDFAAALEHAYHDGLLERVVFTFVGVHIAGFAANKGFVYFDVTSELAALFALMRLPNPMEHEPSSFLTDSECPMEFPGGDPVLGISKQPHGWKPLVQAERRVLKDGSDLDGELALWVVTTALPAIVLVGKRHLCATAGRALHYAVRPAFRYQIGQAVFGIGEVNNRFLQGLGGGNLFVLHDSSIAAIGGVVKFINAIVGAAGAKYGPGC
jgi:hypothetical protein